MRAFNIRRITTLLLILSACGGAQSSQYEVVNQENMTLYPRQTNGNIGDVMPFYQDGVWHFFYLHDSAPNPGFHPWYRMSTVDFTQFIDHGEVIPVVHDLTSQELALGTGSVIEKDGTHFAFYTAHNGRLLPKETFRLSISTDQMQTWTKQDFEIDPRDFGFDVYDFRDPHVVFIPEKNQYYMLFTTRHLGLGAIGYLVSNNLLDWTKESNGIYFLNNQFNGTLQIDSNLECPTLWHFNGYWYMTFSDQKPTRQTHYLYKKNFNDPWLKPSMNQFDGKGLYAGKVAVSETQMILAGWVSYDFNRSNEFGWGGSFVGHELKQNSNGTLYVDVIAQVKETISTPQLLEVTESNVAEAKKTLIEMTPVSQYQHVVFNKLTGINRIEGILNIASIEGYFGIFFDYRLNESSYHYDFNLTANQVSFYRGHFTQRSAINRYTTNTFFNTSNELRFTLLFEETNDNYGSIVTLYIQGQVAQTARMFRLDQSNFGFYGLNSSVTISNLVKFK
jgi:beta-fructofuranosidase